MELRHWVCGLALLLALPAPAQDVEAEGEIDARVARALKAEKLEYSVDAKGNAKVVMSFSDDAERTQLVTVQSVTFSYRQVEFREIFSAALKASDKNGLDLNLARRLLEESSKSKLAFWGIEDDVVWAIARIPADASSATLREAIDFVAVRADELEKERLGTDEF
jgi:hypothetical protein